MYYRGSSQFTDKKGTFDPNDASRVKHTRLGVWDLYEEFEPGLAHVPGASRLEKYMDILECTPYVWRMIRDVVSIPSCAVLFVLHALINLGIAIVPALGLWYVLNLLSRTVGPLNTPCRYQGRLLQIVSLPSL